SRESSYLTFERFKSSASWGKKVSGPVLPVFLGTEGGAIAARDRSGAHSTAVVFNPSTLRMSLPRTVPGAKGMIPISHLVALYKYLVISRLEGLSWRPTPSCPV